jgi:DUF2919 family protein
MRHIDPELRYPASAYDDQMCLKAPLLLWLAVLYLSRAFTLPIAMAIGHFAGVDSRATVALRSLWSVDGLIPSVIAAVVLYALFRRVPTASGLVRWIWARGRMFLLIAAGLDILLLVVAVFLQGEINDSSLLSLSAAVIDLYFLVYLLAARRVRQVFSEFPLPLSPPDSINTAKR